MREHTCIIIITIHPLLAHQTIRLSVLCWCLSCFYFIFAAFLFSFSVHWFLV